jgi:hypothetical protein
VVLIRPADNQDLSGTVGQKISPDREIIQAKDQAQLQPGRT